MSHDPLFVLGGEQVEHPEKVADCDLVRGPQKGSCAMPPGRCMSGFHRTDPPGAVHAEMTVQGQPALDAVQEVLPSWDYLNRAAPEEICGRQCWHPKVAALQYLPCEGEVQPPGCAPDGITLGHRSLGSSP